MSALSAGVPSATVGIVPADGDGETEGLIEGDMLCEIEPDGEILGETEGEADGEREGETDGEADGEREGEMEGEAEGLREGDTDGLMDAETGG